MFKLDMAACLAINSLLLVSSSIAEDNYQFAELLEEEPVTYHQTARRQNLEGWAYFSYTIDTDGKVSRAQILDSNGVDSLDAKLLKNLESKVYKPASFNGITVEERQYPARFIFLLEGLPRGAEKNFVRKYKRATSLIASGELSEAATMIESLKNTPTRSLYEELYLQTILTAYTRQLGDTDQEYLHIKRVIDLLAVEGNQFQIAEPDFFIPHLARAYQIEVAAMRLGDAFRTASRMNYIAPENEITQRVLAHAESVNEKIDGEEFWIQGKLVTPLYGGDTGTWNAELLRREFELKNISGELQSVEADCRRGRKKLSVVDAPRWSLPESWGACTLRVEGIAGSTFVVVQLPRET